MADSTKWAFDQRVKRYRNLESGKYIARATINRMRDDFADKARAKIGGLAASLADKSLSVQAWEVAMREAVKTAIGAQYVYGRGGLNNMEQADWGRAGSMTKEAYGYLRGFAEQIAAGELSEKQINARSALYLNSTVNAYERGRAASFGIALPVYPADGGTACMANCVTGDTLVEGLTQPELLYRRWYVGPLIKLATATGRVLTITPNHPILTERGWIAASQIEQGDKLIGARLDDRAGARSPYVDDLPAERVEALYARAQLSHSLRVAGVGMDFHGDVADSEVEIIPFDRALRDDVLASGLQPCRQHGFGGRGVLRLPHLLRDGARVEYSDAVALPATSGLSGQREIAPPLGTETPQTDDIRLTPIAWDDATIAQYVNDQHATTSERASDSQDTFPGSVARDDISTIEIVPVFAGHVYNLQTDEAWYIANGVIIHNCRCRWEITETKTEIRATWVLNASAEHCADCEARASTYSPYTITKGS